MKSSAAKSQSGQALVELAIALPVLLALAIGVIDIGRYAYVSILIGNAARAGAAYGSSGNQQSNDQTGIRNAAQYDFAGTTSSAANASTFSNNGQLVSAFTVTSTISCGCDSSGSLVSYGCDSTTNPNAGNCPLLGSPSGNWVIIVNVTASGDFNALFNYPGIPSPVTISRTASMRVQ